MGDAGGEERRFALRGGVVCLDFVNTVGWRLANPPKGEYLDSYADLLAWGSQAGVIGAEEKEALSRRAALDPEGARIALRRAIALREAVYGALRAVISGRPAAEDDLSILNGELSRALGRARLVELEGGSYGWGWDEGDGEGEPALDRPLWPVARSAADLLVAPPSLSRVRMCAGKGCGWLFLDESRNGRRIWCDSDDCGNRERVRRHLARKKLASGS